MSGTAYVKPGTLVAHGTPDAYANGCRCGTCSAFAQAHWRGTPPPAATPPKNIRRRRAGRAWTVRVVPAGHQISMELGNPYTLTEGHIIAWWTGTNGILFTTEATWDLIETNDAAITCMQEAQEEAKRTMPRAVVRDVATYAGTAGKVEREVHDPRQPDKPPPGGIRGLKQQIVALVEEMARFVEPTVEQQGEFARRYGKLRDQMATQRRHFVEAEGAFEVAQARIIEFMDQE